MRPEVEEQLLGINRAFYQSLGTAFASTRQRLQPGIARLLPRLDRDATVLDLGCGHGLTAEALVQQGHRGEYVGVDNSPGLVALARDRVEAGRARFLVADLAHGEWETDLLPAAIAGFDWVLAFAVLHHIPGDGLRQRIVGAARALLGPGGRAAVSVWDFLRIARLRRRIVDWSRVGLSPADVEPGDALLDWRHAGEGLRYVHHFPPAELSDLARGGGFEVEEEFRSDGEGGALGLYQVWRT